MSRIFTIDFQYKRKTYSALVTMVEKEQEMAFQVQVQNSELSRILTSGQMFYQGTEALVTMEQPTTDRDRLMYSIATAIEQYLMDSEQL